MRVVFLCLLVVTGFLPFTGHALKLNEVHYGISFRSNLSSLSSIAVEVYNDSETMVFMGDYALRLNNINHSLPNEILLPHRHFTISLEGIDLLIGQKLELIEISGDQTIDIVVSVGLSEEESYARVPDGTGAWSILRKNSLGRENRPDYSPEEKISDWVPYSMNAPFGYRDGAGAVVFKGEMWLLGGWAHGPLVSDIWKSKNGVDWEHVTDAPWPGRHQFGAVVFNNKIWVIGGDLHSDVWNSDDGINWNLVTDHAPWGERYSPYVCVFNNKLWLMGGQKWETTPWGAWDYNLPIGFNDVWSSSDGVNWAQATASAEWEARSMINGSVVFQDKMWILGGGIKEDTFTRTEYNDVWSSADGVHWELVTDSAGWKPRIHLSAIVHNNKIWITDGSPGMPSVLTNEVWSSEDGVTWNEIKTDNRWSARHASSLFDYDGSLWIVAGFNANNVWQYTEPPMHYYSGATGQLSDLTSWTTGSDGTGENPKSFTHDNQIFVVTNRSTVVLSDELRVEGQRSKIIIGTETDSVTFVVNETAVLDALVDVSSTSTLVIGSSITPSLNRLHQGSTVVYAPGQNTSISPATYYNLSITEAGPYVIHDRVAIYGTLDVSAASPNVQGNGLIDVYGDLNFNDSQTFSSVPIMFSGSEMQQMSFPDTAVFGKASLDKLAGSLTINRGNATFNQFSLYGGSLIINEPIKINSPIDWRPGGYISFAEKGQITIECPDAGQFVLPMKLGEARCPIVYSVASPTVLTAGLIKTDSLLIDGQTDVPQRLKNSWYINSSEAIDLTFLWDGVSQHPDFSTDDISLNILRGSDLLEVDVDSILSIFSTTALLNSNLFDETFYYTSVHLDESTDAYFVIADNRLSPQFSFNLPAQIRYGDRIALNIVNDAGLPMQHSFDGAVEITGDTIFAKTIGSFVLSASTEPTDAFIRGRAFYNGEVLPAIADLQFDEIPRQQLSQAYYLLTAESSSPASITFHSENEKVAAIRNDTLFFRGKGTTTITARQDGTDLFEPAVATQTIEVEHHGNDTFVMFYPNPSPGNLVLLIDDPLDRPVAVSILGEFGQLVYKTVSSDGHIYEELNLETLANGLYLLVVEADGDRSVKKLVVAR